MISTRRTSSSRTSSRRCEIVGRQVGPHLPRPRAAAFSVTSRSSGRSRVSLNSVRDRVDLLIGKPIDPAQVAKDIARIDSLYQSEGYYLARVTVDSSVVQAGRRTRGVLTFHVDEGRRLAIAGVEVEGNKALSDEDDRRRDQHEARGILLVAQRRVRRRQVRRGSRRRTFRRCTRRTASSTCRS